MLVLGAAISGAAAARLAKRKGHAVTVYDQRVGAGSGLLGEGIGVISGRWDPDLLAGMELVVASPGVPVRATPITDAHEAGVPVWSEIEFAWRYLDIPVLAVTGTNGKTTVTEAATAMLASSGLAVAAVGNIGTALSSVVDEPYDLLVAEVSSFQLEFTDKFHPQTAVLTNLAPDHLDWHPSYAAYAAAKAKIFANQDRGDLLVFDSDDAGAREVVAGAPSPKHPVSGWRRPEGGSGPEGAWLHLPGTEVELSSLPSTDPIILVDLAAAGVAALHRGARPEAVVEICRRFRPGANRRQLVGEVDGIAFVNDSKATNPHAALASIRSFPSVVLIAGGLAKGLDVSPLATAENVRMLVAIGEAAPALVAAAPPGRATLAASMVEAVEAAFARALPGDTVLLAPGCASFDMFDSYEDRGASFVAAVRNVLQREMSR
ncbi:MAG TPA: UDP-N-acetylmuramoyl-L-alanine--D-glutamate ligase [Acidimicrobiia bacterium]|nr:UDP-N-acetylmuramoyl-L-alanine--D-glutamate ligase [Acidimicrobiia bacterium]